MTRCRIVAGVGGCLAVLLLLAAPAWSASPWLKKVAHGDPQVSSIDVISFGPDGLLLIGDGRGSQIVVVETKDTSPVTPITGKTADIVGKLAARLGTKASEITLVDLAVNPASGKAYFAVRNQADKSTLILTLDGAGEIDEFALEKVDYVQIPLAADEKVRIGRISDVAWADDRLIAAGSGNDAFASKIFAISAPLEHKATGNIASAETYHVSHRRWETRAPMSVIMPFKENGRTYVAGAFACTPVVKYPLDAVTPGAKVKGSSVIELGSGNRPLDMLVYEKGGKEFVLSNTFRFHHERKPFGPSPYWTVKFERSLLGEDEKVNEQALFRLGKNYQPATERIQMVESMHGVVQMDKLDDKQVLVLRTSDDQFDLEALPLP